MTTSIDLTAADGDWTPAPCTLPTAEQPLRTAEFDALFADAVRGVDRITETAVRLTLDPGTVDRARELAARETECCSFFQFSFAAGEDGTAAMRVTVPPAQVTVLEALAARAAAVAGLVGR